MNVKNVHTILQCNSFKSQNLQDFCLHFFVNFMLKLDYPHIDLSVFLTGIDDIISEQQLELFA